MKTIRFLLFLVIVLMTACKQKREQTSEDPLKEIQKKDSIALANTRIGIKMNKIGGVYQIPCYVNGVKMNFIFDTGASDVCISLTEAAFLAKNGYLEDDDYIGKNRSQIADGTVIENMEINLNSIEIEGIMLTDVKATVVKSIDAPLLLGQSALKKLGRIEIEGDSLFIVKKGKTKVVVKPKKNKINTEKAINIKKAPITRWYDGILATLGYDGKCEEYLAYAWWAYDNELPEVAIAACDSAIALRKTAKAYGLKGFLLCLQFYAAYDDTNGYLAEPAIKCLEEYIQLNNGKKDYGYLSGDTLHYNSVELRLAFCYMRRNSPNYKRALDLAQDVYLRNPKSSIAMTLISECYSLRREYGKAEKWAKKLLNSHLDDFNAYCSLAFLASQQNRMKEAIRYYEKCLEIDSEEKQVLDNLGHCFWNLKTDENWYGSAVYGKRYYAVSLWKKAARSGYLPSQRVLKEKGIEW